jgi:hypothetical protein
MMPILPHVHIILVDDNTGTTTSILSVNGEDSYLEKPVSQQTDDVTRQR